MFIVHYLTLVIVTVFSKYCQGMDFMPCTEGVDAAAMALARRIIDQHIPPGYRLLEYFPATQTGMLYYFSIKCALFMKNSIY